MTQPRSLTRVLLYAAMTLVLAFVGTRILAGETSLADRRADLAAGRLRPPRFTVAVQFDQVGIQGYFTEVTGLSSENEIVEYRDGNDPNLVRKLPGRLSFGDVTLKRGILGDTSLWQWRRMVEVGDIADARSNGKITLLDRGTPVATWHLTNAWPAKISGPELNAEGNDVAIEELVLAHEGLSRE